MNKTVANPESHLLARIARGMDVPTTAAEFNDLAREVFAFQVERNAAYGAFCKLKQLTTDRLRHWREIPAVPATAFKQLTLTCFPAAEAVAEFHTSGTTREQAGRHLFRTLSLYDAALAPCFDAHLFPDDTPMPLLSLVPDAPHSSLAHMIGVLIRRHGGAFVVRLEPVDHPVCVVGTAFHFLNLFDQGIELRLPAGSRAMETGGFKGRTREVAKAKLHEMFEKHLGIPSTHVVNEYGMTELSTQFYDETLRVGRRSDVKRPPPWARVIVIDPQTGNEAPTGERGLLRIFDLANLWSALCVQTEDWGVATRDGGFLILGRAAGAEPRGCSLNAETLRQFA